MRIQFAAVSLAAAVSFAQSADAEGITLLASPVVNISNQINIQIPINVSPATAVAFSVYGPAVAKAATVNRQSTIGFNWASPGNNFISGY